MSEQTFSTHLIGRLFFAPTNEISLTEDFVQDAQARETGTMEVDELQDIEEKLEHVEVMFSVI